MEAELDQAIHTVLVEAEPDEVYARCTRASMSDLFQSLREAIRAEVEEGASIDAAVVDSTPPTFLLVEIVAGEDAYQVEIDVGPGPSGTGTEIQFALLSPPRGFLSRTVGVLSGRQSVGAAVHDDLRAFKAHLEGAEARPERAEAAPMQLVPHTS